MVSGICEATQTSRRTEESGPSARIQVGHPPRDHQFCAHRRLRSAGRFRKVRAGVDRFHDSCPALAVLVWAATRHLGKQWRYEAALSEDHELIQTGPYRWLRHPIYTSMLLLLLAAGLAWTWWPMLLAALVFFVVGTEIRVRAEDRLLAGRFQESFGAYRSRVRAYIPFIR